MKSMWRNIKMSEIVKLIQARLYNQDKDIQELAYTDPHFHYFYSSLRDIKEDNPEFILNFIVELCKTKNEFINNYNGLEKPSNDMHR